jgi:hypothetical protein
MAGQGSNGLATAVELLGGMGDLGLGGEEQPELFADAGDDAPAALAPAARSGPQGGRPKGARNRSTEEWRRYLLSRYQSPLVGLAEIWSRTPAELAKELGLYKFHEGKLVTMAVKDPETGEERQEAVLATGEAAAMQLQARVAALPYLHQKLPQAVEISAPPQRGVFLFGELPTGQHDGDQALPLPPLEPPSPIQRNQQVSEAEIVKSDDTQSDGLANALTYKDDLSNDH